MHDRKFIILHKEKRFTTLYIYNYKIYGKIHSKTTFHRK